MTNLADQVITALRSGHDDLSAYAAGLDEKDLEGPSGAAEWTVAQVLSHLGSGAEIGLAVLERAQSGGKAPEGANQTVWARWDAMSPVEQRDGFRASNDRLVAAYEALDAPTRAELRIDLGFLPAPVSVAVASRMRLSEFTLHAWDARVAAQPTTTLTAEAVPLLLDALTPLLGWISKPDTVPGRPVHLAVELQDPQVTYGLEIADGVSLGDPPASPDGVLRAPAEAWMRLLTGRLSPAWTPSTVSVQGPLTLDALRRLFPGY